MQTNGSDQHANVAFLFVGFPLFKAGESWCSGNDSPLSQRSAVFIRWRWVFLSTDRTFLTSRYSYNISKIDNRINWFSSSVKVKQTVIKKATKPVSSASLGSCRRPASTQKAVNASFTSCTTRWRVPHLPAKTAVPTTPGWCTRDLWVWGTTAPSAPRHPPASIIPRNRYPRTCGDPGDAHRGNLQGKHNFVQYLCVGFFEM